MGRTPRTRDPAQVLVRWRGRRDRRWGPDPSFSDRATQPTGSLRATELNRRSPPLPGGEWETFSPRCVEALYAGIDDVREKTSGAVATSSPGAASGGGSPCGLVPA